MGQQYSLEEKERAIQLFQILGHYTWVIAELGYPSRTMLHYWIKEYRRTGKIEVANKTRSKYTVEQRKQAVEYYISHGRSIKNTITALGYPSATLLGEWLREDLPKEQRKWSCKFNGHAIKYTAEQKAEIVQKYCSGQILLKYPRNMASIQLRSIHGKKICSVRRSFQICLVISQ